jgi:hypothetical protein
MNRSKLAAVCLLGITPLLLPIGADAYYPQRAPGPLYQPPGGLQYRPVPQNNGRGTPPANYQTPAYGYNRQQGTQLRPQVELELKDKSPYVQENTLLTLRVISGASLQRIDPILPQNQSVMFHKLKDPTVSTRMAGSQRQIVNEMVYMLVPMRPGAIEVPISVEVESGGRSYTLESKQPLRLDPRPAQPGVVPWLPLEQLALSSNIDAPMEVEEGKPLSLVLKLTAAGATGSQLPSMERLLQSADFRVYREKTETEGGLSQNGRHVMGVRTEHYTLVPKYGGRLRLPSARLTWFNVNTQSVEHTSLPIRTLQASGTEGALGRFFGDDSSSGSLFPGASASAFWLPLMGVFLLLTGYWIGVWYKSRGEQGDDAPSPLAPLKDAFNHAFGGVGRRTHHVLSRLNPLRYWHRAMARGANMLPTSVRFWFWVRCANDEQDPGLWCKTLQFLSCRQLAMSPYAPLPAMAEKVIQFQPRSNPDKVRGLFRQLDGAIYGNRPLDFEGWKRDLKREVRPSLLRRMKAPRAGENTARQGELPSLNPKAAA